MDTLNFAWHWSPGALVALVILCLLYVLAVWQARGRDTTQPPVKKRHMLAFLSVIIIMALVLLTPLDTIARTQLFAAHMLQAVALTTLCAPLLLFACTDALLQPLIRQPMTRAIFRTLTNPLIASILFNATFLIWHTPVLYNLALSHGTFYHVELFSIFLTSLLNWWPLIGPLRELRHLSYPVQMLYAFLDGQPVDIFAFLLVFTGVVFYVHYIVPQQWLNWGYTPVADQTIAGAFLLIPGLVDLAVMSPLFFRWLAQIEQQARVADRRRQEELEAAEAEAAVQEEAETNL